jgi:hypothetical protein
MSAAFPCTFGWADGGGIRDHGSVADPNEMIDFDLTDDERFLLDRGLAEWGGPAYCTDALAVAMGFDSVADLTLQSDRLRQSLRAREPMSRWDWTRVQLATEIVFASDIVGSGVEWHTTTGLDDMRTLDRLRTLQRKLVTGHVPIGPRGARQA